MTAEEKDDAYRAAADNLKQRYERDQKSLIDTLEAERARQRARLLKSLNKRAAQGSRTGAMSEAEVEAHNAMVQEQLAKLERSFEVQQTGALSEPQSAVLVTLSSIFLDEALLQKRAEAAHTLGADEEVTCVAFSSCIHHCF